MKLLTIALSMLLSAALSTGAGALDVDPHFPLYEPVALDGAQIKSVGSDTLGDLMRSWADAFSKLNPNVKIEVESKGSNTAPSALLDRASQLGPMSRPMRIEEYEPFEKKYGYHPVSFPVAVDALAVYVNKENPIECLTIDQLGEISRREERMPPKSLLLRGEQRARFGRRDMLAGLAAAAALLWPMNLAGATEPVSIGLNPLFLDSDIELLSLLQSYLAGRLGRSVQLLKRRTYQEITALLLSGQLDAAWVCDDPYVQHEDQLALLAVPLYRHEPLYQTYVIVSEGSKAQSFDDIRGTVHAFSDPDSTSGFLVTRSLLALRHTTPAQFFRTFFFTYGHRNVVRAVATGLARVAASMGMFGMSCESVSRN